LFILPSREVTSAALAPGDYGYALYNYYGSGPIASAKRRRFEKALRLDRDRFGGAAIDMGTADGILLPSLSRHYQRVAAMDTDPSPIRSCQRLVQALQLDKVDVFCNAKMSTREIRERIGTGYRTMFLLETLEHVGSQPDMWGTKVQFLEECLELLEPDGRIVISVPKMVGPVMLFKNVLQRALRKYPDPIPFKQLIKSSLLYDTEDLEPLWDGHHVGFNHRKLDERLPRSFRVHHRSESLISVFYVIGRT
jgi:2-polyprenyl-3-methyl-5-hydroxy-6-metoxy-1,4-benzoquinol methylase